MLKYLIAPVLALLCSLGHANTDSQQAAINIGDQRLVTVFNSGFSAAQRQKLRQWITAVAKASTHVYGHLPLATTTIQFIAYRSSRGPVPFGTINRQAPQGIRFYVNPDHPLDAFINDWTAYHEFSHLMIPSPGDDALWFSEGLASYYQNIIMGRSGVYSPLQAWQRLYAGFVRGANDTKMQHLSLKQLSPRMRQTRSFMRVYWSGAYYFFAVDIALRKQQQSLDKVLAQLQQCCLDQRRDWTVLQLIDKLDELSGTDIFSREYAAVIHAKSLQGFEARFADIGLLVVDGKLIANGAGNGWYRDMLRPHPLAIAAG